MEDQVAIYRQLLQEVAEAIRDTHPVLYIYICEQLALFDAELPVTGPNYNKEL